MSGIYIHIPFCKQACYYCDFHFSTYLRKKDDLISCLIKELVLRKNELVNETIETIYFGGGTPSLLSPKEIQLIMNTIQQNYSLKKNLEITLEANPDDLTSKFVDKKAQAIFKEYMSVGINRLSIGIQSFFEQDLQMMNRAHNAIEAKNCLTLATKYFENITIDLIYGIPKMSNQRWKENLSIAFDFGIKHISSYALTVEPKTILDKFIRNGKYPSPKEEVAKDHFDILINETQKKGFIHYEISNFGIPGYFSKHNTSYWLGKKYLGIGPSAHSFNKIQRSWNVSNNIKYIKDIQANKLPSEIEKLSVKDQFNEYIMTGLRTIWGVSLIKIREEFGEMNYTQLINNAQKFINEGLLNIEINEAGKKILKTTEKGKFLSDGLSSDLFII